MIFPHTLHIVVLWRLLDIMDLCTHPILVQKEDIESILSFYTKLRETDRFPDIILFGDITFLGKSGVSRVK